MNLVELATRRPVTVFMATVAVLKMKNGGKSGSSAGWFMISLMYILTSDTVEPFGKLEFFWRSLAGPFNFIPGV